MSLQLVEDKAGDLASAAYLLTACELAYAPEAQGAPGFREKLGLDARLITVSNTQAYVGQNDRSIVVAFRGSESPDTIDGFKDWLVTNANNFLVLPEGQLGTDFAAAGVGARFHKGFIEALAEFWDPLYLAVDTAMKTKERPLWITGHSLGGALALMAAWRFQQQFIQVHEICTFGAPMVGNNAAAEAFKREFPGKIFRYVDAMDIVPKLPTISLITNTYTHCLAEQLLGGSGTDAEAALKELSERSVQNGNPDTLPMDDLWNCLKDRIDHHMVSSYLARIEEKAKGNV
ncbi:lipase family protein [Singulisphaera sp. Ch08]|uniref:Lipase family protein n=1 Tax=Singulisphaera sp. Ch08 TaxID=3120278 RepID=A0AAU7CAY6_9BACT